MINVNRKTTLGGSKESPKSFHNPVDFVTCIDNWHLMVAQNSWSPPTDICESEYMLTVRMEIAGMNKSDFSINLDQSKLTISGSRVDNNPHGAFHQMEIHSGRFLVAVCLPSSINTSQVSAEYQDGFLTITLPKFLSDENPK
jgi:HSP20 family molecular chaperone IbpA